MRTRYANLDQTRIILEQLLKKLSDYGRHVLVDFRPGVMKEQLLSGIEQLLRKKVKKTTKVHITRFINILDLTRSYDPEMDDDFKLNDRCRSVGLPKSQTDFNKIIASNPFIHFNNSKR